MAGQKVFFSHTLIKLSFPWKRRRHSMASQEKAWPSMAGQKVFFSHTLIKLSFPWKRRRHSMASQEKAFSQSTVINLSFPSRRRRRRRSTPSLVFSMLLLLFQLLHQHVTSIVGMGYMTTLAGLWANGMATAACALEVGTLHPQCWGNHPYLGDLSPPSKTSFYAISGGGFFVCGLLYDSRNPSCWGQVNDSTIPSQFLSTSYSNINSGGYHACAVRDNETDSPGLVDCWGNNTFGQASPPLEAMIAVTAGDFFTCGLTASTRHAICWGQGSNSTEMQAPDTSFEAIFAGRYHMCGVERTTMKTRCWGNNTYGQATPVENVNLTVITGGYSFSCGLRADTHEAVCWGETYFDSTLAPVGVPFAAMSSGDWFTCGVREDDEKMAVNCWGTQNDAANTYVPTSLRAGMGLCVVQCNEGEYELENVELGISNQCPGNTDMKVCLKCLADQQCPPPNSTSTAAPPTTPPPNSSSHSITGIVVGVALAAVGLLMIGILLAVFRRRLDSIWMTRRKPATSEPAQMGLWRAKASRVKSFSSEDLRAATKGYDHSMMLGKGGFGNVYKGILGDGQVVAIKKASSMERAASTFDTELELLVRVNHTCLVNLVGYCEEDKCLVFEFMANGSLQDCLFRERSADQLILDWNRRMKVALQAARGLEYLHVYASPTIIHRDVKASNILLDESLHAHISDFGLSLYGPVGGQTHLSNQSPCGTVGYVDPEYYRSGKLTAKSDVYSFGVVLLELLSGRQAVEPDLSVSGTVAWAVELAELGNSSLILDPELTRVQPLEAACTAGLLRVIALALQCVRRIGKERPTMSEVATCLQGIVESTSFNHIGNADGVQISPPQSNCSTADISSCLLLEGRKMRALTKGTHILYLDWLL